MVDQEICKTCGGDRVVSKMEQVYAGEPHMAPIGEEPCPDCSLDDEEEEYDQHEEK